MKNIIFNLNDNESISVELSVNLSEIFKLDRVSAFYNNKQNSKRYCLVKDVSMYVFGFLSGRFNSALQGKLKLHESIKGDIGYIWSKYLWYDEIELESDIIEGRKHWIGKRYLIWSNEAAAWIYEEKNKIIFEITPNYDYNEELSEEENELQYQEFLKNYKPLVVTEVTREAAQKIVEQAEKVLAQLDTNHETENKRKFAQNS